MMKDLNSMAFNNYGSELKVMAAIKKLTNEKTYPYLAMISNETGLTRKTVLKACGELLRSGVVDAGNARIDTGRWVRIYLIAGEGELLAQKIFEACYETIS